ncbi:MAG: glycosyltransferase [Chthoniobacterales bacterium]
MKLIFLCHPASLGSMSMPRFARLVGEAMRERGHSVEYVTSAESFGRIPSPAAVRKWLGYIDQFLVFPRTFRKRVRQAEVGTIFVVTDHALGMWVPLIKDRPHIIHCHDFLAQRSALGEFPENRTGWSGRIYQWLIRRGYRQGRAFVSVSNKTREDLHRLLGKNPSVSEVVYNPLNYPFEPLPRHVALEGLGSHGRSAASGFILHVGGNKWYKNRAGVVAIYRKYCATTSSPLPLWMIGSAPSPELHRSVEGCAHGGRVEFLSGLTDRQVHCAYALAALLLFPSLEEGFGWPIAEAQASGCPVLTTDHAPMTEVGADAARYLPRLRGDIEKWAGQGAKLLDELLNLSADEREAWVAAGLANAARFNAESLFSRMEALYRLAAA